MSTPIQTILCLGDSYTIGEGVALHESFPYQTVQLLRTVGLNFYAPEIVAKTGWTSFELEEHLLHIKLNETYDFVTLLIGVNNQYRGLSIDDFRTDFEFLLKKAIHFSGNRKQRVVVFSIPDWGVTPFAKERDAKSIATEIDAFNRVCEEISNSYNICFINITNSTREAKNNPDIITHDGLHYSPKELKDWSEILASVIIDTLKMESPK